MSKLRLGLKIRLEELKNLPPDLPFQVNLNSPGERHVEVHVGSPAYIKHTCSHGTAADSIMQQLLGIGDVPATSGDSEEASALSVRRSYQAGEGVGKGEAV